jgi:hypothetical protein
MVKSAVEVKTNSGNARIAIDLDSEVLLTKSSTVDAGVVTTQEASIIR